MPGVSGAITVLEEDLPYGEVLFQGEVAYERAVFIGNLLYRLITPYAVVLPRNVSDIQKIVKYCHDNKVRLTVKNGGHSYAGYCLNDEGIVLDMSAMNSVIINPEGTVVSIQGGATWDQAYAELVGNHAANILIGGQCPFVGVSGFTLGGGLSPFSRSYGLGVDNVIEMRMVTATGELVTLSAKDTDSKKKDLFWALRGGGGGNFGVLVDFTSKVYKLDDPNGHITAGELTWTFPQDEQDFKNMMNYWNTHTWSDALTIDMIVRWVDGQMLGQMTVIYNGGLTKCMDVVGPLLKFGKPDNGLKEMPWSGWVKSEEGFEVDSKVFHHHASVIIAEGGITKEVTDLIVSFVKESHTIKNDPGQCSILWDHIGGATKKVAPSDTAFFWREGVYVMTVLAQWTDATMNQTYLDFVNKCKNAFLPHAIKGKAAYLNYIDSTVKNWQEAYYGDNYKRLQGVKDVWDPTNFFHFDQSVELTGTTNHKKAPAKHAPLHGGLVLPVAGIPEVPSDMIVSNAEPAPGAEDATVQTKSRWDAYSIHDPKVLDGVTNHKEIYKINGVERIKSMRGV